MLVTWWCIGVVVFDGGVVIVVRWVSVGWRMVVVKMMMVIVVHGVVWDSSGSGFDDDGGRLLVVMVRRWDLASCQRKLEDPGISTKPVSNLFALRCPELKNQVQRLMEAYIAPLQPIQVNKITSSFEICSGPHDTQYCMENPKKAFIEYASSRIDEAEGAAMVKNPKLNVNSTSPVLSAQEYEQEGEGNPENTNTVERKKEQRDTPQLELKEPTAIDKIGPSRNNEEREIEWLDIEEPLDLVDTCEESVYESLIKEMPKCSLKFDFRIKKGDPRNLKIPCMIGHKFIANAYIHVDLPMNIMSLAYYNSIRKSRYEYRGRNFVGLGRDMHVFVGNMSYVMDFTILENIETNIEPNGIKEITFKTPYKDLKRSEFSSKGHDLLSSRIILSEDDYDRGCRKPSDLEDGFYRDTIKLGHEYLTGIADEGEVT
ncbi:hypothetical protein Tco_0365726 [Tanacetum coccineum]